MGVRKYDHGPCPKCDHPLASGLGGGRFRCNGLGCFHEFAGRERRRKRLGAKRKTQEQRDEEHVENYGDLAKVVRGMPCLVQGCRSRRVEVCHVKSRGAGAGAWLADGDGKAVSNLIPLCMEHHREQHNRGVETFPTLHTLVVETMTSYAEPETLAEAARLVGVIARSRGVHPPQTAEANTMRRTT